MCAAPSPDPSRSPTWLGETFDSTIIRFPRAPTGNAEVALALAEAGLAIFPASLDKRPQPGFRWKELSSSDAENVERWWDRYPDALPAVDCAKSGLVVLDLDRHDGGSDGVAAGEALLGDLHALGAPITLTRNEGLHIFFRAPPGENIGNATGSLPAGIDVRHAGYVIAPGGALPDGTGWRCDPEAPDLAEAFAEGAIPELPAHVLALIRQRPERPEPPRAAALTPSLPTGDAGERERRAAETALEHESAALAATGEGGRNAALNGIAFRLGRMVGAGWIARSTVERALEDAAQACGLVADDGWPSIRKTMASGLDAGLAQPADALVDREGWGEQFAAHAALGAATARALAGDAAIPPRATLMVDGVKIDAETGEVIDDAKAEADAPTQAQRPPVVELQTVNAASFADQPIPEQEWLVPDIVPANNVTLLSGDGGTGKSLLSLQLAVAVATGGSWIGYRPQQGPAVFLSAEDETDELHRRLARIEPRMERLSALTIIPLAGEDAVLAAPHGRDRLIQPTALFKAVAHVVATHRPMLLVLDTAADLFAGNENARTEVRTFISMLRGVCLKRRVTIVLLSHPSQSGLASGSGSSGSTSWNNSVRSRLYFSRRIVDRIEDDPDLRVLEQMKSNRSRVGGKIVVRWKDGRFVREAESDLNARDAAAKAEHVFLRLLALVEDQGRPLSDKPGSNYAPAFCARHPDADGIGKEQFVRAMERLFRDGVIGVEQIGPASRNQRRIVFTPGNRPAAPPVFDDTDEAEAEDGGE
jgi:RecA-family ATPase